jgi:hypothetical protein
VVRAVKADHRAFHGAAPADEITLLALRRTVH